MRSSPGPGHPERQQRGQGIGQGPADAHPRAHELASGTALIARPEPEAEAVVEQDRAGQEGQLDCPGGAQQQPNTSDAVKPAERDIRHRDALLVDPVLRGCGAILQAKPLGQRPVMDTRRPVSDAG